MPERFHDRPRIDSLRQQQRRCRVPEVVVADRRQTGVSEDRLEQPSDGLRRTPEEPSESRTAISDAATSDEA